METRKWRASFSMSRGWRVTVAELEGEDPEVFADAMIELRRRYRLSVLGGCCGTDERHIRRLAERLSAA